MARWRWAGARRLWARLRRNAISVWFDDAYRLPLASIEGQTGLQPRRAEWVLWFLRERGAIDPSWVRAPARIEYGDLARVHTHSLLDSLHDAQTLGRIFAVDPPIVPVEELLRTVRLACGATLAAAREAIATGRPALNLMGGFHHAGPNRAGGFCAVNDVAVAIAALRHEGFASRIAVLDLDSHPPDGTAECLAGDDAVWIGSLSGSDWQGAPRPATVDETRLPDGCGDLDYLVALGALLGRMPRPALAFVLAGGDVLGGDRLGRLGLSLGGARERDLRVASALDGVPAVWLPAGGYHADSWRLLAGTGLALARRSRALVPADYDPLRAKFEAVAAELNPEKLHGEDFGLDARDIEESIGMRPPVEQKLLLGYYSIEGIEYALFRYGILGHLARLGFERFRMAIDTVGAGERGRVFGWAGGTEHLLIEVVLEKQTVSDQPVLYVHWLCLRDPRGTFSERRPQLPGQDAPGLGIAQEIGVLLAQIARRLGLGGVAFRPAWYHMAYAARYEFRFVDPARQGRFEAMVRDLAKLGLREATIAVSKGQVRMNGQPYVWEADEMVYWIEPRVADRRGAQAERDRVKFTSVA